MRVGLKLTMVILSLLVTVLCVEGWLRLRYEREVFESDVAHEQRLLGRALRPSVELAWRSEGLDAAQTILEQAQRGESEVSIRLVGMEPGAVGATPASRHPVKSSGPRAIRTVVDRIAVPGVVYTYVPIASPTQGRTAIELAESLAVSEARLERSAVRVAWTALVLILGAGVLAVAVGERLVTRPVRKLAEQAARIARGDLSPPEMAHRRDELGELKLALRSMVEGLAEAREHAAREAEARLEAERRLRQGERLAAVGTLAAGVAHELGTPLQIVSGRARMIERDRSSGDASTRNASIVREQAQRMERIVRQLLSLTRPVRLNPTAVALADLVQETLELLRPNAESRRVQLEGTIQEPAVVWGDHDLLCQVLSNLVQNAIQAVADGGNVRVRLHLPATVQPPAEQRAPASQYACIEVVDEGPGIAADVLPRVFDPFFTTKDVGQGTGLGLSVAYGIAREHEGWIEVHSEPGKGAMFSLLLPVHEEEAT